MRFDPEIRLAARPAIAYDDELPVSAKRAEIAEAIRKNQVVIVCGETGSGKTTQLPKICLELGRGAHGLIGHTQPRRIAARATATRIAQELKSELGRAVGFKIRFTDRVSPDSYIKLMTDGILLAETQGDPQLRQYDTLIIDEAHERSLNIDFLLGYLKQLLPKRPELKVIVTSATLDADRFSKHFNDAPVIEVSGRLYPIEMRWRPPADDVDLPEAIVDAVDECHRNGPGDVLVFLPGEREIREAAEALRKHHPPGTELLPLYARQSAQEQQRVFAPAKGRRVVLATNVAETSLTVPGIRYVVDSGLARVKRYSHRNKVEMLQVEDIARSAANQRAGRCGRVMSGVCIRLYAEDDYQKRLAHTEPELLRSSLAGVILRMKSLHLGEVEDFPFLDRPLPRMVTDGYQLLAELGAVDDERELTQTGRELARLPLDPRIARMILAARDGHCLREMLVIAAALSVQDPRERPQEQAGAADQAHAKWRGDEPQQRSEFLAWLNLWKAFDAVWMHESQRKQRDWCRKNFLSYLRMREWREVHAQLHTLAGEHSWRENEKPATYEQVHKALLSGLLGNLGLKSEEEGHYLGARGIRFWPHPGSALAKKAGRWIVAAELVETTRLYARCLAKIEPEWLEAVGAHLVRKSVYDPHWEKRTGQVRAWERATLHGLVLYAKRPVTYGRIDPKLARELFIREGLVQGALPDEMARHARFFQHNRKLVRDIEQLEHKTRRQDVLVDEELIFAFYDAQIPAEAVDVASFERWRKDAEKAEPKLLYLTREQLMRHDAAGVTSERFPPQMEIHGQRYPLAYHFEPGAEDDGVTLTVPVAALNQVPAVRCEWLVPGLLEQKAAQFVKTLPQKYRHRLQPVDEFVADFAEAAHAADEPFLRALTRAAEEKMQLKLPLDAFRAEMVPPHFFMNFRAVDEHGRMLGQSRDLAALRSRFAQQIEQSFARAEAKEESEEGKGAVLQGLTSWSFGELPEIMEVNVGGRGVIGFPALVDEGGTVALRVQDTPEKAAAVHRKGLRRLFALELREQVKFVEKSLPRELGLLFMAWGTEAELKAQIVAATLERTCMMEPLPAQAAAFARRKDEARARISLVAQEIGRLVGAILTEHAALQKKLATIKAQPAVAEDIKAHCAELLPKGFVEATPFERLAHFPRYLKAAQLRIDKQRADPARDARLAQEFAALYKPWERERLARRKSGAPDPWLEDFRWLLEELRVALFAQELKTPMPVSVKRLQKAWESRPRH
ncbi:MAG: ATP-dependent helicase [Rhodocyclaceae bacterium]|uniref:ATP-dependent RNA helicase HrpA n=1 Tax=Candidatus Desulfobacillus denitrificans TaxID=2608985 RepID=A0A809S8X5_9PROT|nr:ATP-dependent RNA helicase HrpA [Candidatus Desulfobacillus denitrificans]GJQ56379.1 MAG: ATP-dependent helicase [Rhodocyclaceae bacterium]